MITHFQDTRLLINPDEVSMIRVFGTNVPGSGNAEFRQWLADNPDGFFVSLKNKRSGTLHRGNCPHMIFRPGESFDLVKRPKWASSTRRDIKDRAEAEGVSLAPCDTSVCRRP
jgi:hypothetical protein